MKYLLMTIGVAAMLLGVYTAGLMVSADHNYKLGYEAGRASDRPCPPPPPIGKAPWQ